MSRLLIDAGSSCLKWVLAGPAGEFDGPVKRHCYADQPPEQILIENRVNWAAAESVWVASVLDEERNSVMRNWFMQTAREGACHFARVSGKCCGISCAYPDPGGFGIDRWLALLAAGCSSSGDKLVIDLGTAITADFLAADGVHRGGMIAPGVDTMLASLGRATNLGQADLSGLSAPGAAWADNTREGVQTGIRLLIEGFVQRAMQLAGEEGNTTLIVTGGSSVLARDWLGQLDMPVLYRPDLVLTGLHLLASETPSATT